MNEGSLESLTIDSFKGLLGNDFSIRTSDGREMALQLVEVNVSGGDSDARDPFALIFLGPMEPVLQQAIHTLTHEKMGRLDLFLVPIGPDQEQSGIQYEAVFS